MCSCHTYKAIGGMGICAKFDNTIWWVIFAGTNFRETGQNLGFRNFCSFNFHGWWIWDPRVGLTLRLKAERMSRIAYKKRWKIKIFVPVQWEKYPRTQDVRSNVCFRSRSCAAVWLVRLCLRTISISWIASAIAVKGTLADTVLLATI